ncbi:STAS domain-containing protein [Nonomuraea sp. NPDC050786]|uniref:STAS domain-containing protein n=1 Tax=Nonomuraea sp. NPDC050786 TaxID=3154840 RepID=UPI0033C0F14E
MTVIDASPLDLAGPSAPTTVHLSGEIDIFSSAALRQQLLNTLHYSTSLLILDLSEVMFCDASGLAVMVGVQRRARVQGVTVVLTAPRPFMSRLLRITGLDRSLPVLARADADDPDILSRESSTTSSAFRGNVFPGAGWATAPQVSRVRVFRVARRIATSSERRSQ